LTITALDEQSHSKTYEACVQSFLDGFEGDFKFIIDGWHKYQYMGDASNKIEPTTERAHSGRVSLRSSTVASQSQQKASLAREMLYFPNKSHFYMSAWYFVPGGTNTADLYLFDLESTNDAGNAGRRLVLSNRNGDYLYINSKRAGLHAYQLHDPPLLYPKDKWVHVKIHMYLSTDDDGLTEVWQDGVQIINQLGQTIPAGLIYNWIEFGTTSNVSGQEQVVYADDLVISKEPLSDFALAAFFPVVSGTTTVASPATLTSPSPAPVSTASPASTTVPAPKPVASATTPKPVVPVPMPAATPPPASPVLTEPSKTMTSPVPTTSWTAKLKEWFALWKK
jgi:hypothetical protein